MAQLVRIGASFLVMKARIRMKARHDLPSEESLAWTPGASAAPQARVEFSLLRGIKVLVLAFRIFLGSRVTSQIRSFCNFSVISVTDVNHNRLLFLSPT